MTAQTAADTLSTPAPGGPVVTAPNQVVWKFVLEMTDEPQAIETPAGARLVHAAWFQGRPTVWYLAEPDGATTTRHLQVAATGQQVGAFDQALYHHTLIQQDTFVWHIFELLGGPQ